MNTKSTPTEAHSTRDSERQKIGPEEKKDSFGILEPSDQLGPIKCLMCKDTGMIFHVACPVCSKKD